MTVRASSAHGMSSKKESFFRGDEREYPSGFCEKYRRHANKEDFSCVEIFSGPNAPLSCALAKAFREDPPPPPSLVNKVGTLNELNQIEELPLVRETTSPLKTPMVEIGDVVEMIHTERRRWTLHASPPMENEFSLSLS